MNKFASAAIVAFAVFAGSQAFAQSSQQNLNPDRDNMTTGIPNSSPARPATAVVGPTATDRALEKIEQSRDMSTGIDRNAPTRSATQASGPSASERAVDRIERSGSRDMTNGLAK